MKILVISHEYPPIGGGGANAAYHLLNGFIDRGHIVTLVTTAYPRQSAQDIDRTGFEVYGVDSKRSNPDSCSFVEMLDYLLKAYRCADRLVNESIKTGDRYDICIVFFGIPSGPIGYMLKKRYKLPYVIRFGGGDIPGFQKRFTYVYKLLAPAIRLIWRNADARIANSEGLREMALRFCDKYKFVVIPNGVDTELFSPVPSIDASMDNQVSPVQNEREINVLFVSRLIERKGIQHIIPIIGDIARQTNRIIRLTVVGEGPYKDRLLQIACKYGVADDPDYITDCNSYAYISFKGNRRGKELIDEYRAADMFILPSSNEGMPNVVLEAMACGLPIIMTPCQGSSELIEGNGVIASIDEFKTCIIRLVEDDNMRKKYAQESRKRAVDHFSWQRSIEEYLGLLTPITYRLNSR